MLPKLGKWTLSVRYLNDCSALQMAHHHQQKIQLFHLSDREMCFLVLALGETIAEVCVVCIRKKHVKKQQKKWTKKSTAPGIEHAAGVPCLRNLRHFTTSVVKTTAVPLRYPAAVNLWTLLPENLYCCPWSPTTRQKKKQVGNFFFFFFCEQQRRAPQHQQRMSQLLR